MYLYNKIPQIESQGYECKKINKINNIKIRSFGNICILPPSVHARGRQKRCSNVHLGQNVLFKF